MIRSPRQGIWALAGLFTAVAALSVVAAYHEVHALVVLAAGGTLLALWGVVRAPHWGAACVLAVFALLPTVRILWLPWAGPVKEASIALLLAGAACVAMTQAGRPVTERAPALHWSPIALLAVALSALYFASVGGPHDLAWFHGTRLTLTSVVLLGTFALLARSAPRATRFGLVALLAIALVNGVAGFLQQVVGADRLAALGFAYNEEIRTIGGQLRSFGLSAEPFSYAIVICIGITIALLAPSPLLRVSPKARGLLIAFLVAALALSFVRTSIVILAVVAAVALVRNRQPKAALLLATVSVSAAVLFVGLTPSAVETRTLETHGGTYLNLNERTDRWADVLGSSDSVVLGQGVGRVGTGAERAAIGFAVEEPGRSALAGVHYTVDSAYVVIISDVGLLGLLVYGGLLAAMAAHAYRRAAKGCGVGWLQLGLLSLIAVDGLTRDALGSFPASYCAWAALGLALGYSSEPGMRKGDTAARHTYLHD